MTTESTGEGGHRAPLLQLEATIRGYGPTLVALSGGVDSSLVAAVAYRVHGARSLAVTGVSPSLAAREHALATEVASRIGIPHRLLDTDEVSRPGYRANRGDRCYHCKSELFDRLVELAEREGFSAIVTGDNLDDLGGHRPGMVAAAEHRIRHPLIECGLGKAAIRELALALGLPNHAKPAAPCLASRVPHGTPVDPRILARIEAAEAGLHSLGFDDLRVRHHGDLARLELPAERLAEALARRQELVAAIRAAGYLWVSLDLEGLASGSLNRALPSGLAV